MRDLAHGPANLFTGPSAPHIDEFPDCSGRSTALSAHPASADFSGGTTRKDPINPIAEVGNGARPAAANKRGLVQAEIAEPGTESNWNPRLIVRLPALGWCVKRNVYFFDPLYGRASFGGTDQAPRAPATRSPTRGREGRQKTSSSRASRRSSTRSQPSGNLPGDAGGPRLIGR